MRSLLRNIVPGLTRVAFLADATNPPSAPSWEDFHAAAPATGVQLQRIDLRSPRELEAAFETPEMRAADAVWVGATSLLLPARARLTELTRQHRLPSGVRIRQFVESGLLMSYGPSLAANARQAATVVDKILKGANPGDLPVQQPTQFALVVNLKTAKALGLTFPQSMLLRADEVIQ